MIYPFLGHDPTVENRWCEVYLSERCGMLADVVCIITKNTFRHQPWDPHFTHCSISIALWMQSSAIHPSAWTRLSDVLTTWLSTSIINKCTPITEVFKMVIHKRFAQHLPNFGDWHFTECVCNLFFLPSDSMFHQFDSLHDAQNARRVTNESLLQVVELFSHCQTAPCPLERLLWSE